ncbi:MAG: hypothetical protein JSR91_02940 [Proteobacteria bacterium]|nr:hypothetical protein [Pseudomonadota bacterium]
MHWQIAQVRLAVQMQSNTITLEGSVGSDHLSDGQLLIGSTGGAPQPQALTAGQGILITNGPGNITVSATSSGGGSRIQHVASAIKRANPLTSLTTQHNVTAGNLLIVATDWYQGSTGNPTISDTLGTPFSLIVSNSNTGNAAVAIFVGQAAASGSDTVTIAFPSGASWQGISISEFKNTSAIVDDAAVVYNAGISLNPTTDGDLIFTYGGSPTSAVAFTIPPPAFLFGKYASGSDASGWSFMIQNTASFVDCTPSNAAAGSSLAAIALKPTP